MEQGNERVGHVPGAQPGGRAPRRVKRALFIGAALLLAVAALPRVLFLAHWEVNFDADEALLALQASQLFDERPTLFIPGQSYGGSLPSAVAAPLLQLLGHHANVARLAVMLWILPGLAALIVLDRRGRHSITRGRGLWFLALLWLLPPGALFFAGVKLRGGQLESLVLGLWAALLLWPAVAAGPKSNALWRWTGGGLLYALAIWTHDQLLLLAPLILVLWACDRSWRGWRALGFAAGFLVGYVPLWLPRFAASFLGPPGTEGTEWGMQIAGMLAPQRLWLAPRAFAEALTARGAAAGSIPGPILLLVALVAVCCAIAVLLFVRRPRSALRERPALVLSLWLAAANLGAFLVSPQYFQDPSPSRYAVCMTPFMVYSVALALTRLPKGPAWGILALLSLLTLQSYREAHPGWEFPADAHRKELATHLEKQGVRHVLADWSLAYFLRFTSAERILCAAFTPPRDPQVNAAVDFAPAAWHCTSRRAARDLTPAGGEDSIEEWFSIRPRAVNPPLEVSQAFAALDPQRTLWAHYEPWPVLRPEDYRRDWRGWPYRRPLAMFDAIVWQPERAPTDAALRGRIADRVTGLVTGGEFATVADWSGQLILRRAPAQPEVQE